MNYYPNFMYQPYQNQYQAQYQPQIQGSYQQPSYQQQIQNQPQQTIQPQFQQVSPTLNGKIVDGKEIVTVTEIPLGSYGIFPKADMSAVYIKAWNADGTTQIFEYEKINPDTEDESPPSPDIESVLSDIYDSINALSKKIDTIKTPPKATQQGRRKGTTSDE